MSFLWFSVPISKLEELNIFPAGCCFNTVWSFGWIIKKYDINEVRFDLLEMQRTHRCVSESVSGSSQRLVGRPGLQPVPEGSEEVTPRQSRGSLRLPQGPLGRRHGFLLAGDTWPIIYEMYASFSTTMLPFKESMMEESLDHRILNKN